MATDYTAVTLAVRVHPRGSAPSGDEPSVRALREAASAVGRRNPEMLSGPSSVSHEGVLLLTLSSPGTILETILAVADELRPLGTTFCAAVSAGAGSHGRSSPNPVESSVLAAEAAASLAQHGVEDTDVRERRVSLLALGHDALMSALAGMVLAWYDAMTERQRQIISLIKESDTQQEVASHLDVSRQAVNQSLAAAGWSHLRRAEDAIREHLSARFSSDGGEGGGTTR
ncbi:MAG: sigma factor-like helix-turn-helix DNA-binding protein [Candidatus Eisenbacteria bacterium]|nr:sigma factor-like helix-turn-helix DNA-binding protein [Candidatus Eisenbacteria bacterium]